MYLPNLPCLNIELHLMWKNFVTLNIFGQYTIVSSSLFTLYYIALLLVLQEQQHPPWRSSSFTAWSHSPPCSSTSARRSLWIPRYIQIILWGKIPATKPLQGPSVVWTHRYWVRSMVVGRTRMSSITASIQHPYATNRKFFRYQDLSHCSDRYTKEGR